MSQASQIYELTINPQTLSESKLTSGKESNICTHDENSSYVMCYEASEDRNSMRESFAPIHQRKYELAKSTKEGARGERVEGGRREDRERSGGGPKVHFLFMQLCYSLKEYRMQARMKGMNSSYQRNML